MRNSILLLVFGLIMNGACAQGPVPKVLDAKEYQASLKEEKDKYFIDVRTPGEYQSGHIEGAVNWNFHDKSFLSKFNDLDKEKAVYVYCRSGGRSGKAARELKEMGFKKVVDLKGGILAWPYTLKQ